MTPAGHANTVRHALENDGPHRTVASRENALAALDALQAQAETAEAAFDREAGTQDALDEMRAERDHARAALRRVEEEARQGKIQSEAVRVDQEWPVHETIHRFSVIRAIARAALGDKPAP